MPQPCVFIPKRVTEETLATAPAQGKHLLEPFKTAAVGSAINILEDDHLEDNQTEVHRHEADLWICLEGEVDFVVGGELIEPWAKEGDDRELKAKVDGIKNGTKHVLRQGDILFIPAGQPHVHTTKGTGRLYIIKVPQPLVELPDVPGWNG
ncbi:MAG TPA: hypothetical protein VJI74_02205 [Candidatus Paceibacterota bacterium]